MSSGLSHKKYNYEVPPPAGVWDNISAELDEVELSKNLSSKLYNIQIAAPAGIWADIANELDESEHFQNISSKLNNIQVAPPAGIWENIAVTLDESTLINKIAERLQNTEVAPPATAWNKIVAELDEVHEAAVPDRRWLSPFVRYAAAASIIGLIAFSALQLFKNKGTNENDGIVKGSTPVPEKINSIVPPVKEEATSFDIPEAIADAEEVRNDAALEASKKTYAKLDKPVSAKMDMAAAFYFNNALSTGTTRSLDYMFDVPDEEPITNNNNSNSRYIMLMTPDGNIIRMSKKLGNLICCVSGEEQDDDCMHQLNQWKEKLANSYAGHSPGNFMDIFSLVNSLQDNTH